MIQLQFVSGKGWSSDLIEWFGHGLYSHVDCVMPDGRLLGARLEGGVAVRSPDYEVFERVCRVGLPVEYSMASGWAEWLLAQVGKPYDKTAIAAFAAGRDWQEPDSWFCSELAAASLIHCGYFQWPLVVGANKITPDDLVLVLSSHVQVI